MNSKIENDYLITEQLEVNPELGQVKSAADSVRLGPVNMRVLLVLMRNQGQVVSRAALFEQVWKNQVVSDDTLTRCISDIRAQLKQLRLNNGGQLIETVPKRGYRWLEPEISVAKQPKSQIVKEADNTQSINQQAQLASSVEKQQAVKINRFLLWGVFGTAFLLLLSSSVIYLGSQLIQPKMLRVALLPTQIEDLSQQNNATIFEERLRERILATDTIRFLSSRTTQGKGHNLYPYLFREFSARWIVEARIRRYNGSLRLTINLVDAKTAIVIESVIEDIGENNERLSLALERLLKLLNDMRD
jgi:DNA-binding winged helix-turn-helix (wHTH) protein/TolB-like protein